jgi:hypothetical protein
MGSLRRGAARRILEWWAVRPALLRAVDELLESFVTDNDQLSAWQLRAVQEVEPFLRPWRREQRRAARAARWTA